MGLVDLIFPKRCIYCLKKGSYICRQCRKAFERGLPECFFCRRISAFYRSHDICQKEYLKKYDFKDINDLETIDVTYLWRYDESAKMLMSEAKYTGSYHIFTQLGGFISERMQEIQLPYSTNVPITIIPIPQHRYTINQRGFNHTLLISKSVEEALRKIGFKVEVDERLIRKKAHTPRQASLMREERYLNLSGSFSCQRNEIDTESQILLVDDVITTGSTITEVALTILRIYPKIKISGVALFRGRPSFLR